MTNSNAQIKPSQNVFDQLNVNKNLQRKEDHFNQSIKAKAPKEKGTFGALRTKQEAKSYSDHFNETKTTLPHLFKDHFGSEEKIKNTNTRDVFSSIPKVKRTSYGDAFNKQIRIKGLDFKDSFSKPPRDQKLRTTDSFNSKIKVSDISEKTFKSAAKYSDIHSIGRYTEKNRSKNNTLSTKSEKGYFVNSVKIKGIGADNSSFTSGSSIRKVNSHISTKQRKKINFTASTAGFGGFGSETKFYNLNNSINSKQRTNINKTATSSSDFFSSSGKKIKEYKHYVGENKFARLKLLSKKKPEIHNNDEDAFSLSVRDEEKMKRQKSNKPNEDKLFQKGVLPNKKWKRK